MICSNQFATVPQARGGGLQRERGARMLSPASHCTGLGRRCMTGALRENPASYLMMQGAGLFGLRPAQAGRCNITRALHALRVRWRAEGATRALLIRRQRWPWVLAAAAGARKAGEDNHCCPVQMSASPTGGLGPKIVHLRISSPFPPSPFLAQGAQPGAGIGKCAAPLASARRTPACRWMLAVLCQC